MQTFPPNPRKTTSVRFLGPVDIRALREAVLAIPDALWAAANEVKPNRFEALDRTEHVVFRFVSSMKDWTESHDLPLWPEWRARLEPVLHEATAPYGYARGVFPRVMLARMAPGGVIHPHRDGARAASWPHKIHVPLLTNPQVRFFIEPRDYHFEVGQAYEVNNLGAHAVVNDGPTPRIHLIFEYYDADQPGP